MIELTIICDGGSIGNGTTNSIGYGSFMIFTPSYTKGKIHQLHFGEGITNNEAEYKTLIGALEHVSSAFTSVAANLEAIKIVIRTDSQLIIGHICEGWKTKPSLIPLKDEVNALCRLFDEVKFDKISGDEMKQILGH